LSRDLFLQQLRSVPSEAREPEIPARRRRQSRVRAHAEWFGPGSRPHVDRDHRELSEPRWVRHDSDGAPPVHGRPGADLEAPLVLTVQPTPTPASTRFRRPLLAVLLVGALLRVVPIWFGLPFDRARPDEETAIGHALAIVGGDLNPHFFHWPSLTF